MVQKHGAHNCLTETVLMRLESRRHRLERGHGRAARLAFEEARLAGRHQEPRLHSHHHCRVGEEATAATAVDGSPHAPVAIIVRTVLLGACSGTENMRASDRETRYGHSYGTQTRVSSYLFISVGLLTTRTALPRHNRVAGRFIAPQRVIIAATRLIAPVLDPAQGLAVGQARERVHATCVEAKRAGASDHPRVVFFGDGGHDHGD